MFARQRGVFGFLFLSLFLLGGCSGPEASSLPQRKTSRPADSDSADSKEIVQPRQPAAEELALEPVRTPAPPKPRVKQALNPPVSRPTSTRTLPEPSKPAAPIAESAADVTPITPPVLIQPVIPPPGIPPVDEPEPAPAEPVTREVRIPSGTLIPIRMIDAVDSASGHEGESFRASVDAPVIVRGETVIPDGAEAWVKLTSVQSAGNLRGTSELKLQLDRVSIGEKDYTIESSAFVKTGSGQGAKTARTAGLGAAIGAAIGAIAGGGKGAAIGAATGAGAGVGVEAVTKGEQVRVDSETRLDFRLEESLEVTLESSPSKAGPPRLGTR
jgi:hypothetical protein